MAEDEEDSVLDNAVQEDAQPEISAVPEPQNQVTISSLIVSWLYFSLSVMHVGIMALLTREQMFCAMIEIIAKAFSNTASSQVQRGLHEGVTVIIFLCFSYLDTYKMFRVFETQKEKQAVEKQLANR